MVKKFKELNDIFKELSDKVLLRIKKEDEMNSNRSKLNNSTIKAMLISISRIERELDILLTQCEGVGGFGHFYPTYSLEKMKTMRSILEMELEDG